MRPLRSSLLALTALTTVACTALLGDFEVTSNGNASSSSGGTGDGGDGEGGAGAITVTPTESKVGILRSQKFTAMGGDVDWSVQEGEAGGTIDATGKYISPEKPGIYNIVAKNKADPTKTATVKVTVVPLGLSLVVGKPGGPGNLDGAPAVARFRNPGGFAITNASGGGGSGNVMYIADTRNHTVRKFDGQKVTTLAGTAGQFGSMEGTGAAARFNEPRYMAADAASNTVYVYDYKNNCIRKIDSNTGAVSTFTGQCTRNGTVDGDKANAGFDDVDSMVMGPAKKALYVCERDNNGGGYKKIRRVELTGAATGTVSTIITGVGGQATMSGCQLAVSDYPNNQVWMAISTGSSDALYYSDETDAGLSTPNLVKALPEVYTGGIAILKGFGGTSLAFSLPQGGRESVYRWDFDDSAGSFTNYFGVVNERKHVDGPQAAVRFNSIAMIVGDEPSQSLHIVDEGSHTIRRVDYDNGSVATILGSPINDTRIDGPRASARLTTPFSVTTDDSGQNVFISDICFERPPNNTIRKYDTMAATVSTVSGVPYRVGGLVDPPVDGPKDAAKFGIPIDMVRLGGDLFVLDLFGSAVRKVNIASGEAKTIAGELTVPGNSDGVGALAHFRLVENNNDDAGFMVGIATDGTSLYVADAGNFAIRKVNPTTGDVTTIAGGTKGSANGVGKAAQFMNPLGLAIDGGFLYIADALDGTIRRMDLASTEVTTFMGLSGVNDTSKDGDATQATFARPARLAADGIGNLYVTETPNFETGGGSATIRRIDIKRKLASTFAGAKGSAGFMQGPLPGSLNCPSALHVNAKGDLMFTDFCDGIVGVVQPL